MWVEKRGLCVGVLGAGVGRGGVDSLFIYSFILFFFYHPISTHKFSLLYLVLRYLYILIDLLSVHSILVLFFFCTCFFMRVWIAILQREWKYLCVFYFCHCIKRYFLRYLLCVCVCECVCVCVCVYVCVQGCS